MILRGIDFGHVLNSSGARNFDGSGWGYHKIVGWLGLDYEGSTFVAKTTTLNPRAGNMKLKGMQPANALPDCIKIDWRKGIVLNAVGLSGPGAEWLLRNRVWIDQQRPFFLSFMSVESTRSQRIDELRRFVQLINDALNEFDVIHNTSLPVADIGLQINFSCPNVGLDLSKIVDEIKESLDIAGDLGIPLVPKINATVPPEAVMSLLDHPRFDALCVSNTIPWGQLPHLIDWEGLFGTTTSPLAQYGGGGLSGKPLLPIVVDWIARARNLGFKKPIIGGGGILSKADADLMLGFNNEYERGADAIELGSVSMLRPWRVRGIIKHVNRRMEAL